MRLTWSRQNDRNGQSHSPDRGRLEASSARMTQYFSAIAGNTLRRDVAGTNDRCASQSHHGT